MVLTKFVYGDNIKLKISDEIRTGQDLHTSLEYTDLLGVSLKGDNNEIFLVGKKDMTFQKHRDNGILAINKDGVVYEGELESFTENTIILHTGVIINPNNMVFIGQYIP